MVDRIRRRLFLVLLALSPLLAHARSVWAGLLGVPRRGADPLAALPAYLDTLIPEHLGPSATGLAVDRIILEAARAEPRYGRLLVAGCRWLEAQARKRGAREFRVLPEEARVAIVQQAEDASPDSGEWAFHQKVRADAFQHYYSNPRSWNSVGFARAPQPTGYMGYAAPPVDVDGD